MPAGNLRACLLGESHRTGAKCSQGQLASITLGIVLSQSILTAPPPPTAPKLAMVFLLHWVGVGMAKVQKCGCSESSRSGI